MLCELDAPGEYYVVSASEILFITPDGKQPSGSAVVSVFEHSLVATDLAYVTFRGIAFQHARLDGVVATDAQSLVFSDCDFSLNGAGGIVLDGVDSLLSGNTVRDVGCSAVNVTGYPLLRAELTA